MARPRKYVIKLTDDELKTLNRQFAKVIHLKRFEADARLLLIWMRLMGKY